MHVNVISPVELDLGLLYSHWYVDVMSHSERKCDGRSTNYREQQIQRKPTLGICKSKDCVMKLERNNEAVNRHSMQNLGKDVSTSVPYKC